MAVRLGVIGTGGISHAHAGGYAKLGDKVELVACCDLVEEKAKAYAEKYGYKRYYTDYKKMLAEEKLDAVSVCTWNAAHAPISIAALDAGVNVICEKPTAMNEDEALAMQEAAKRNNKLLMIGFVRRYGNDAAAAKDFIEKDYLGDIYFAKASYIRRAGFPGKWFGDKSFSGGGPLIDLGVHIIDLTRYLMGNPKPVSAYGVTFDKLGQRENIKSEPIPFLGTAEKEKCVFTVEDLAIAVIKFDNGATLSVETSFSLNTGNPTGNLELFGTKAGLSLSPFKLFTEVNDYLADIDIQGSLDFGDFFACEMGHFIDCVANGTPCRSPIEDGVQLMKILDAIYLSAATNKVVDIK